MSGNSMEDFNNIEGKMKDYATDQDYLVNNGYICWEQHLKLVLKRNFVQEDRFDPLF